MKVLPKPSHLGPEYAAQFDDERVVEAYQHRSPYPADLFDILSGLITTEPRTVLDAGCGTGNIARYLTPYVDRIDAVDISARMIAQGKTLPGGDHPRLQWLHGAMEEVALSPPYSLITAGQSLHWMAWDVVFGRFRQLLVPGGLLTIIDNHTLPTTWDAALAEIISRYSTNREYQPYNLVEELTQRSLFEKHGEEQTEPVAFKQSIDDYIESFHARNGLSRDRMTEEAAAGFDQSVRMLVSNHCPDGIVHLHLSGHVIWGIPLSSGET
jgi:trans-aconitate methyltransferase